MRERWSVSAVIRHLSVRHICELQELWLARSHKLRWSGTEVGLVNGRNVMGHSDVIGSWVGLRQRDDLSGEELIEKPLG